MKLGSIHDVKVPAQVVLGSTDLGLGELSQLAVGSIIELRSLAGEPVDLVVAGEVVARGEVVVIEENFGIRVTKLVGEGR
jgi:flagellar motor switch protein FliN/FliY